MSELVGDDIADLFEVARPVRGAVQPSDEQKVIIAKFLEGRNIKINAVAGAGKSTTLRFCAEQVDGESLILTFNKDLQREVEATLKKLRLDKKIHVRTYHSAASIAYGCLIANDKTFKACVAYPPPCVGRLGAVSVIMMDEAQDQMPEYCVFVRYLIAHRQKRTNVQLIVVGDPLQAIYGHKNARAEFLTECERAYPSARQWSELKLTTSYRLTPATAAFVNAHVLGAPLLVGGNAAAPDVRPTYLAVDTYRPKSMRLVAEAIKTAIRKYGADNVAILAASVRKSGQSPIAVLIREHLAGELLYVSNNDESMDKGLAKGKLAITTFHAMKGCERDCIIVMGFDEAHFVYYEKEWGERGGLPNPLYVAATRARKELIVVAHPRKTFRSVGVNTLADHAIVTGEKVGPPKKLTPKAESECSRTVSDMLRHLNPDVVAAAMEYLTETKRRCVAGVPKAKRPPLAAAFKRNGVEYLESVAPLYGSLIPAFAELEITGTSNFGALVTDMRVVETMRQVKRINDITRAAYEHCPDGFWEAVRASIDAPASERTLDDWMRITVANDAVTAERHHIARQILDYDWVEEKFVRAGAGLIKTTLGRTTGTFEKVLPTATLNSAGCRISLMGCADFVSDSKSPEIWEFKCTDELRDEHLLQLGCYLAMSGATCGHLYAILSGEIITVRIREPAKFLQTIVMKMPMPTEDILDAIARIEATGDAGNGPEDAPEEEPSDPSDLDDLFT